MMKRTSIQNLFQVTSLEQSPPIMKKRGHKKMLICVSEMAQQGEEHAATPDNLTSVIRVHVVGGANPDLHVCLMPRVPVSMQAHVGRHTL